MGLDFWNLDWGGGVKNVAGAVGNAIKAVSDAPGNVVGYVGHEFLGGKQQDEANARQDQINSITQQIQNQTNPYAANNPGLQALMDQQNRQFDAGQAGLRASLAARGMLGGGQEGAALNGYEAGRGATLADLNAQNYQNAQGWETDRQNRLLDLYTNQRNYYQQQADAPAQAIGGLLGTAATIGGYALGGPAGGAIGSAVGNAMRGAIPAAGRAVQSVDLAPPAQTGIRSLMQYQAPSAMAPSQPSGLQALAGRSAQAFAKPNPNLTQFAPNQAFVPGRM